MIEVSNLYKKAVYAPSRKTSAVVEFQILNNEAYTEVDALNATSNAPQSRISQIINKVRRMSKRYATFEPNYWLLDGSFYILPSNNENLSSELGWWSDSICNDNGIFPTVQDLEISFSKKQESIGLTLTFDPVAGEYPADFTLSFYGPDDELGNRGELVATVVVTNHQSPFYVYSTPISGYWSIVISITKWKTGNRRARVTEIDFGVIQTYDGNKLMNVSFLEEMNVVGDTLPSNEIKFVVDNTDKTFNILNPQGYYKFLERNQEVSLSLGLEVVPGTFEYVNINKYYLTDWQSDEGTFTTTFTARDFLDALEKIEYISIADTTLYALAEDILIKAGISNYQIDPELQKIRTQGFKTKVDSRKGLQCIGIAGRAAVYQDRRLGIPVIRRFAEMDARTTFLNYAGEPGMVAGAGTFMYTDGDYLMKSIDFDNAYKEPQIKLDDAVRNIDMSVITYAEDTFDQVLNTAVTVRGKAKVFLEYQKPIISTSAQINITGAKSHTTLKNYDSGIEMEIVADGEVVIVISGKTLAANTTVYTLSNPTIKEGTTLLVENPLINTPELALEVGSWLASEFAARAVYSISWRQNPALECGDIVLIEDSYGNKKQSRITKQEYTFQGYLRGKSETKGGV
ncbi:hypothetical protein [Paenibacillus sp. FSL H7-0714]|uniref:hypothetical protein n=1 Tax=Paenibacillus sp. FSL H7-0714 TaxID=2954735 RepID=UPI0030F5B157